MISLGKARAALLLGALVMSVGCGDDSVAPSPKAATLKVVGLTAISASANLPAPDPVRVQLVDSKGVGIPNRLVTFSVTSGAKVSDDSVFTDETGVATIGVTAGPAASTGGPASYTVTASSEGVTPVSVVVTATNPAVDLITIFSGNAQSGLALEPILPFTALVLNELGLPVPGVTVSWQVVSGGGSVNPTSSLTDASGRASTTLTLGPAGAQTVRASAAGLSATSTNTFINFSATIADPCAAARQMAVPGTLTRNPGLDTTDCHNAQNRYLEYFNVTVTAAPVVFTQSSTAFVPSLTIRRVGGTDTLALGAPVAGDATIKAFLAPGTHWLAASTLLANTTGAYGLTSALASTTDVAGCESVYIMAGTNTGNQQITPTDCQLFYNDGNGAGTQLHYGDRYRIFLRAGDRITITQEGTADHFIRVTNPAGTVTSRDNFIIGGTETLNYVAATTGEYLIDAATFNNNPGGVPPDVGGYKLTIAVTP